jgi:type II restriction/modification system DNA methylase subunit YeeA
MQTTALKNYAPQARQDFISAVADQAARLGITANEILDARVEGDVLLTGGQAYPATVAPKRKKLVARIKTYGYLQTIDAVAYTWFNRLVAIRYMELHGYLDHGYRVLSHPNGDGRPEILEHATDVDLPGLEKDHVLSLQLDGTRDEELYRLLLIAQCNALSEAMPFLFEKVDDESELLLPNNLLHSDSLIRDLVSSIDEGLWQEIEIIGWLYQFYISEKKDQVIGKVVKSEDIPAATQLFTPNWIVKYMVQNSLGAQWLATYPESPLKAQMEYYIEPAEQTEEVNAQLAAITPNSLNPEELTLIDPASGSGHILVEAYELFKAIYLERGYRRADLPKLILEKNLYGLDIDERAAQLTGFALMMKGRADDRRLFERGVKLNVMALVDSTEFDAEGLANGVSLSDYGLQPGDLRSLKELFEHATTFGSLIQVPEGLAEKLPALKHLSEANSQDLFVSEALTRLGPLVQQAELLAAKYDAVVANPPYMGNKGMNGLLKIFAKDYFPDAKSDLFAMFIERGYTLAKDAGYNAMVTMQSWMFLSSFEKMRERLLREKTIRTMAHMSNGVMGIAFGTAATTLRNAVLHGYVSDFSYTSATDLNADRIPPEFPIKNTRLKSIAQDEFKKIPGSPVAYWVSDAIRSAFEREESFSALADVKQGLATADDQRFLRRWQEIDKNEVGFGFANREEAAKSGRKWFPFNKGGEFRRWYGNQEYVVNWEGDGTELMGFRPRSVIRNPRFYFCAGFTWNQTGSGTPSFRYVPPGFVFAHIGSMAFPHDKIRGKSALAFLNSRVSQNIIDIISPTMGLEIGHVSKLPVNLQVGDLEAVKKFIHNSRADWNAYERSWDFQSLPLLTASSDHTPTLESSYTAWIAQNRDTIAEMKRLEEENNRLFIDAYGLQDELTPDVPIEQITLTVNPAYRYGGKLTEEELWTRFREDSMQELVSYAIGCMMGRYSLDAPGLIYAHSGNEGFDPSKYPSFPADDDGIIPLTDMTWFEDDAAHRFERFLATAWPEEHLEENLNFLAANLSSKRNESPRDTLRRYLATKFYKDHLQTYKKRPIYWLFSSGKQRAFQCLVYLHRYNEGTLARMRTEYVIPLSSKISSRIEQLADDIAATTSTAHQKSLSKERDTLIKQREELQAFDEKLRHYADKRISLDLDDGVKVNYGKFGDLLAEVKAVHGQKAVGG